MKISLLCTDPRHPVVPALRGWQAAAQAKGHEVALLTHKRELVGGDVLFLVSCAQMIGADERAKFRAVLVLHASDLPNGRGWSPHVWAVLGGAGTITVSLLEAREPVDSGDVWLKVRFTLDGHELLPEINEKLFRCELDLMSAAIEQFDAIKPEVQSGDQGSYLRKRTPEDSRLLPEKTLAEQFDLLRVVDNERYPAYFDFRGRRYLIKIEKINDDQSC